MHKKWTFWVIFTQPRFPKALTQMAIFFLFFVSENSLYFQWETDTKTKENVGQTWKMRNNILSYCKRDNVMSILMFCKYVPFFYNRIFMFIQNKMFALVLNKHYIFCVVLSLEAVSFKLTFLHENKAHWIRKKLSFVNHSLVGARFITSGFWWSEEWGDCGRREEEEEEKYLPKRVSKGDATASFNEDFFSKGT